MIKKLPIAIVTLLVLLSSCWKSDDEPEILIGDKFKAGQGIVEYSRYEPLKSRPIRIHYYIPTQGDVKKMPILFVLPGVGRNADDYLNAWIAVAKAKQVMVFSFEFPSNTYTSSDYIEGGLFSGSKLQPESLWTFSMVENIFDNIKADLGGSQANYDMFGHSAGAQFVHRYVTFKPNARINRAVSANAGWYTVPDFTVAYPYGLKNSPATSASLAYSFSKSLIVLLGTADTDPNDANLNHSALTDAQGMYRYARGLYYWQKVQDIKAAGGYTLSWQKNEVAGVAHEYVKMSAEAAKLLY